MSELIPEAQLDLDTATHIVAAIPGLMKIVREEMRAAPRCDIDMSQQRLLAFILQGHTTSAELAELQGCSLPAISKAIDVLVEKGYVRRTFQNNNKKQIIFQITPKGKTRHLNAIRAAQIRFAKEISPLTMKDKKVLLQSFSLLGDLFQSPCQLRRKS